MSIFFFLTCYLEFGDNTQHNITTEPLTLFVILSFILPCWPFLRKRDLLTSNLNANLHLSYSKIKLTWIFNCICKKNVQKNVLQCWKYLCRFLHTYMDLFYCLYYGNRSLCNASLYLYISFLPVRIPTWSEIPIKNLNKIIR